MNKVTIIGRITKDPEVRYSASNVAFGSYTIAVDRPVAKDAEKVVGVLLLSKKHNMICCLAVAPEYRRNGIASALLEKALAELDSSRDITVTTFRDNDEKGIAPRALYKRLGFAGEKLMIENDYPVQRFVLRGSL